MKKALLSVALVALVAAGYLAFTAVTPTPTAPSAVAALPTYTATVYVAGMGGHFAQADVTIDPANADAPIKVNGLDRVVIGDKKSHPTHDARIDVNDPNTMFWSTYKLDEDNKMHVGKSDLKTGEKITDIALPLDPRSSAKGPMYCASGQSKNYFMPVFMGDEGYVDVIDKKTMKQEHRVYVSDLGYKSGSYKFVHGINSNDMKTFVLTMNQVKDGNMTGDIDFVLVDLKKLEKGKFKKIAKNTLKGDPKNSITFRLYFTQDNKYITASVGDRLWVLDAKTLKLVDEKMMPEGTQLHDAMPTPDGKYAVLTLRSATDGCDAEGKAIPDKTITDGTLALYDAGAKKLNEKQVSVCLECHKGIGLGDKNAVLCGLDANYK